MIRVAFLIFVAVLAALLSAGGLAAQDLVITNARIIDGTGRVIERGSIVVRGGRIASVSAGNAGVAGMQIDARGMTVMPGFIDAHRHFPTGGNDIQVRMQEFLDAGYTALLHGGGAVPAVVDFKRRVESGEIKAPRIITSARINTANNTPEKARAQVRELAKAGIEFIKSSVNNEPTEMEKPVLTAIADEGRKHGIPTMVHAVTIPAMLAAVEARVDKLVHTPHGGFLTDAQARLVANAGIENLSTTGFGVPVFGVFNKENKPTFRDGSPWPSGIQGTGSNAAGEKAVNARTLWDAGVIYGFGTDTGYHPREGLAHELKTLNLMFSPQDIIKLMGPQTAAFLDKSKDLGTLEPGKLADMVILDGDPLEGYWNLLRAKVVVLGGKVVVDKR